MTSVSHSLHDSLKQIVESLQARFLLPAIILAIGTIFIFSIPFSFSIPEQSALLICVVITISYLFNALNGLIIRLMEGYEFSGNYLYQIKKHYQIKKYESLNAQIAQCDQKINAIGEIEDQFTFSEIINKNNRQSRIEAALTKWETMKAELLHKRDSSFPPRHIMPTTFGNVIKAFEHYPKNRYNMDAIALWPRMFSILKDKDFMQIIHNEKITLDFLANTGFIFIIFSVEWLFSFSINDSNYYLLIGSVLSIIVTSLLFYAATAAARDWGTLVCSAFDLYRYDLYKALNLPEFNNEDLDDERAMWGNISQFIIFGKVSAMSDFKGFDYSRNVKNDPIS